MVLAAGLGTRFRAISGDLPKPLVRVAGRTLLDHTLDMLALGGVSRAVVNVHYKADLVEAHLQSRDHPAIDISDERALLLETGGALALAQDLLGSEPIFCTNTDAIFLPSDENPCATLRAAWDAATMDALLLLVPLAMASGYDGAGDFVFTDESQIARSGEGQRFIYSGLQLISPRLWRGLAPTPVSVRTYWDAAASAGRLRGTLFDGQWLHVGDPEGFAAATARLGAT